MLFDFRVHCYSYWVLDRFLILLSSYLFGPCYESSLGLHRHLIVDQLGRVQVLVQVISVAIKHRLDFGVKQLTGTQTSAASIVQATESPASIRERVRSPKLLLDQDEDPFGELSP